jgi:F0F1-type ATP synthase membrane subunit b/b'
MNRAEIQSKLAAIDRDQIEAERERRELVAQYKEKGEKIPEHLKYGDVYYLYRRHQRRED